MPSTWVTCLGEPSSKRLSWGAVLRLTGAPLPGLQASPRRRRLRRRATRRRESGRTRPLEKSTVPPLTFRTTRLRHTFQKGWRTSAPCASAARARAWSIRRWPTARGRPSLRWSSARGGPSRAGGSPRGELTPSATTSPSPSPPTSASWTGGPPRWRSTPTAARPSRPRRSWWARPAPGPRSPLTPRAPATPSRDGSPTGA